MMGSIGKMMPIIPALWVCLLGFPPDGPEEELARLSGPPARVADVLGEDGVASIRLARKVSIVPVKATDPQAGERRVFVPAGPVRVLSARIVAQLKRVLLERTSYRAIAEAKLCGEYRPSLQIDFTSAERPPFQLLVCFSCSEMRLRRGDGTADPARRMDFAPADERISALLRGTAGARLR
jgi:hypothetical protein